MLSQRVQAESEAGAKLHRRRLSFPALREVSERFEGLFIAGHCLAIRSANIPFLSHLPAIAQCLLPHFTPNGVDGQSVDLFSQAIGIKCFDGVDDLGVKGSASL